MVISKILQDLLIKFPMSGKHKLFSLDPKIHKVRLFGAKQPVQITMKRALLDQHHRVLSI